MLVEEMYKNLVANLEGAEPPYSLEKVVQLPRNKQSYEEINFFLNIAKLLIRNEASYLSN